MADYTLPDDVKDILRRSTVTATSIELPPGQLPRPLYEAVNKALDFIGGKWHRGLRRHVFATDPRPKLATILDKGVAVDEQKLYQAFYTPAELAAEVAGLADVDGRTVFEPSAGRGALVRAVLAAGAKQVATVELNPENEQPLRELTSEVFIHDFLGIPGGLLYERIVMNPPFTRGSDVTHVRHALRFLSPDGILVAIMLDNQSRPVWQGFLDDLEHTRGLTFTTQSVPRGTFEDTQVATLILRVVTDANYQPTKNETKDNTMPTKPIARGGLAAEAIRARKVGRPSNAEIAARKDAAAEAAPETAAVPAAKKRGRPAGKKNVVKVGVAATEPVAVIMPQNPDAVHAVEQGGKGRNNPKKHYPKIMGINVTPLLWKLGASGVKADHAKAILAANGVTGLSETSLKVQIALGRNNARPLPSLTDEQVNELKASAPQPVAA